MIGYALNFMNEIGFDKEAIDSLSNDLKKIYADDTSRKMFEECIAEYTRNVHTDCTALREKADAAGERVGVHKYSAELLMFICFSKHLRELYRENGIYDSVWFDSMCDLKWKLWECKLVKGIWGSFVTWWFPRWFDMTRFALGRLQFEIVEFRCDGNFEKDGKILHDGDEVINVHIPRTTTPIDKASRDDAYARAREFFKDRIKNTPMAFVCSSWLLYPEALDFLPEKSNIRGFMADYTIIRSSTDNEGEYPSMWKLFDMSYTGNVDDYPDDTSLRRAYKEHLKKGGKTGSGYGVFFA